MLCDYCKADFLAITAEGAQEFFTKLYTGESSKSGKKLSVASVKIHHARIRSLSAYIQTEQDKFGIEYTSPFLFLDVKEPALQIGEGDVLTSSEIDRLLAAAKDIQMYLILALTITCGLSVKEIVLLKPQQLRLDESNRLSICFSKANGDIRYVKVPESLQEVLLLHANCRVGAETVFYNKQNKPYSNRVLEIHIKKVMKDAGLSGWTLRDLRNTASFYMLSGGASKAATALQLGISERWMYRYGRVVPELDTQASDFNMIQIRKRETE